MKYCMKSVTIINAIQVPMYQPLRTWPMDMLKVKYINQKRMLTIIEAALKHLLKFM